jgi:transcriptional regulator with XRE-family HTH domain
VGPPPAERVTNVQQRVTDKRRYVNMMHMAVNGGANPVTHFGRQMRKERLARGWSLREFAARTGINIAQASRIETGKGPPTERVAAACDVAFPERNNWFSEYYEESKSWVPAGFRSWAEYEDRATDLLTWSPGIVDGLAQTEGYARALLSIHPGATDEVVNARLTGRMERQRRLLRDEGPAVGLLVDTTALYRAVGSAEVMAEQCARLAEVARLDAVTLQVVPPVRIPLATVSLILADNAAAYTENAVSGSVYTDDETVRRLQRLITMLRAEARPASESLAMIRGAERQWSGVRARTAAPTAGSASKSARTA